MGWTPKDAPAMNGKRVLVTGANSGIGLEAAAQLAELGASVVLGCRSQSKVESAKRFIRARSGAAKLEGLLLDLADLASIRSAGEQLAGSVDVIVNNAGVMALPRRETADGFEMQLGTNHLGHFALTARLLDKLGPAGRVVTVSSLAHRQGRIDFDDLMGERRYDRFGAYAQSKLANLLFTLELQRYFGGSGRLAVSCHPGFSATHLFAVAPEMDNAQWLGRLATLGGKLVAQSAEKGAWPTVRAATDPSVRGGEYFGPDRFEIWGEVGPARLGANARDAAAARRLWEVSARLTGERFP
ncbi:MAG: oxidoreductase [Myxococcota bacterium]